MVVVLLATLIYNSVESSCRPLCLLAGISSYIYLLAPWCVSVAPRGMLCVVSSYRLLYRLAGCLVACSRSPCLLATLVGRLLWSVVHAAITCRWSYRLVGCLSCLLAALVGCLVVLALVSCYLIARSGHRLAHHGYRQAVRYPTLRRGGGFFKKCVGANRNPPRPHFHAQG